VTDPPLVIVDTATAYGLGFEIVRARSLLPVGNSELAELPVMDSVLADAAVAVAEPLPPAVHAAHAVAAPTNAPIVRANVSQRLRENPFDTTIHLRFDDQPDVQPSDLCPYIGVRTAYL
jgi:hypothetical protein